MRPFLVGVCFSRCALGCIGSMMCKYLTANPYFIIDMGQDISIARIALLDMYLYSVHEFLESGRSFVDEQDTN